MCLNRRRVLKAGLVAFALAMFALAPGSAQAEESITFTSWAGPYMQSQMTGFVQPYKDETGIRIHAEHYTGGISEIRDQVRSANVIWDVVDLTQADSLRACNEGLLENLENISLPAGADGTPFSDDFVDGALNKCGVGVVTRGTAVAYNTTAFTSRVPREIEDFFNTDKFPGNRAISKNPTAIMEWALRADGVHRRKIYSTLETDEGVVRTLGVMDSIKNGLQVWTEAAEVVRMLNDGEVIMASIPVATGAAYAAEEGASFAINWNGRVLQRNLFGIPKGSRNKDAAIEFIRYASSSESLARMAEHLPNSPARKTSLALLSDEALSQLPTNPGHRGDYIWSDAEWWSENHARLEEALNNWLETLAE